jgi:hypothetical protein
MYQQTKRFLESNNRKQNMKFSSVKIVLQITVEMEYKLYMSLPQQSIDSNPLYWWKGHELQLPRLAQLAKNGWQFLQHQHLLSECFQKLERYIQKKELVWEQVQRT